MRLWLLQFDCFDSIFDFILDFILGRCTYLLLTVLFLKTGSENKVEGAFDKSLEGTLLFGC